MISHMLLTHMNIVGRDVMSNRNEDPALRKLV